MSPVLFYSYITYQQSPQIQPILLRSRPMQPLPQDTLHLSQQPRLTTQLEPKQRILFSAELLKFNDANKCQQRIFMITNLAVYNIQRSENFIKSMMSKLVNFNKKYTIRRRIVFEVLEAVTLSSHDVGCEMVLHVKNDYDYRFRIQELAVKKNLLKVLCAEYERSNKMKMKFFFKNDVSLAGYCTMKAEVKSKVSRMPRDNPLYLNVQDLADYAPPGSKFQLIYSARGESVAISQFVSSSLEKMKQNRKYYSIQSKNTQYQHIMANIENRHQFINLPEYIYKTADNLYLLRPLMIGGKMDKLVSTLGSFKTELCVFYIAQLVLVLEHLHRRGWVYRATSLSNIYIKENGYIAIDGLNKLMRRKSTDNQMFYDICGLPEDLAPEMLLCSGHNESVDVWGVGVCAYNMIEGHHPFISFNAKETFKNIVEKKIEENQFLPSFVSRCLSKSPAARPSLSEIKADPCFASINWDKLEKEEITASYIPQLNSVFNWEGKLPSIVYQTESSARGP